MRRLQTWGRSVLDNFRDVAHPKELTFTELCVDTLLIVVSAFVAYMGWVGLPNEAAGAEWLVTISLALYVLWSAPLVLLYRRRWKSIGFAILVTALAVGIWIPSPRKAFVNDLLSVRPGMTVEQVMGKMAKYRGGDKFDLYVAPNEVPANATGHWYVGWNNDDGRYDADLGDIEFENGRVVNVEFLPD